MSPREEIMNEFQVDKNGRITSPGRFEGEMLYVPFFWAAYLDGGADRDDGEIIGFDIEPAERTQFPELEGKRTVRLYQTSDGFVCEA